MRWRVLGPLEFCHAGRWAPVGAPKARALLGALLAAPGQVVSTDRLVGELWDDAPPPSARRLVSQYVLRLRRLTGDGGQCLTTQAAGYRLVLADDDLDATQFERLLAAGRQALALDDADQAARLGAQALALWRGPALADVPSGPLAAAEASRLEELRLVAAELRLEADLRRGLGAELVPELRGLTGAHPLRERFWHQLMRALTGEGRTAEALVAYGDARQAIADDLGTDPGPDLRQLYHRLLADDRPPAAGPDIVAPVPRQLPRAVPHFTGRQAELTALSRLLDPAPGPAGAVVVSAIGGAAGVGKTALAVHWAQQATERFPDGQLYVNLRGYDPGQPVTPADALAGFLLALGLSGSQLPRGDDERAARYRSLLAGRRLLVVLDNARDEEQVRPLLPGAAGCAVVVTSRSALAGLVARDGAARVELGTLSEADAARLLRALIGPRAAADPAATAALAGLCGRLPLALRVAAERISTRPDASLASLVAELDDERRLDFLDAGGDPRAAVRAVFSWSFRHLDAAAAAMFRQAGAHPGPDSDACALAALAGTTLSQTRQLLDQLVRVHLIQPAGPGRYGLHDLLRSYARELEAAAADPAARRAAQTRLLDYYLSTAAAAVDTLFLAGQHSRYQIPPPAGPVPPLATVGQAQAWLDAERPALTILAGQAAQDGAPRHAVLLSATLDYYLRGGGYFAEAIIIHGHALRAARQVGDQAAEAAAVARLAFVDWEQGRWQEAESRFAAALRLSGDAADDQGEAEALVGMALVDIHRGRLQQATVRLKRGLAGYRALGHRAGQAHAIGDLGGIDLLQGRYDRAASRLRQSMELAREAGNRTLEAYALTRLGSVQTRLGRLRQAADCQEQALAVFREIGNRNGQAESYTRLSRVALRDGRLPASRDYASQALALFRAIGDGPGEAHVLASLADIDLREARHEQAIDYLERSVEIARRTGDRVVEAFALTLLGDVRVAQYRPAEAALPYRQALAVLRDTGDRPNQPAALNGLGEVALAAGQPGQACSWHAEALELAAETQQPREQARALDGLGRACLALGQPIQARRHWEGALELDPGGPEADRLRAALAEV